MQINSNQPLATYAKSIQNGKAARRNGKFSWKVVTALLGIVVFVVGSISVVLITRKQDTAPVAPTAPQSQPAAYIEKTNNCTLTFDVNEVPAPLKCAAVGCSTDSDCADELVCISATDDKKYCAKALYQSACVDNPSTASCCEAPVTTTVTSTITATATATATATVTATVTATATSTPRVTDVVTTVSCNEDCAVNADCSNVSHICYEGRCRLDVNPNDDKCRLPNGNTVISRPAVVPTQTGPADWLNYIKAGLGVLGVGGLLLLLL